MKNALSGLIMSLVLLIPAHASNKFKDFAGEECSKSAIVTITNIAKTGYASGPMKGYVNVTVTLPNGETSTAPIPAEYVKKIKVGDRACRTTFIDEA